jgi:uncharacterized protein involved in outer membrane biogenesis
MKALKWFCIIFTGLIVVIAITAYCFISSDYASEKLTAEVGTHLGRKLSVEGPLHITWDWHTPRIHAEGIRLANAPGVSPQNMVEISQLDFSFKLWKLLRGRLEVPDIRVQQPHIYLTETDENHKNWDFPTLSGANVAKKAIVPDKRSNMPVIDSLRIEGGKLVYQDKPRGLDMDLDMDTAKANNTSQEAFVFKGNGTLQGQKFYIAANGGSLELLRDTKKPFPLALTLSIGTTKFSINGTFTDPVQLKGLDASLHLNGNNLADLFYLMHIPLPTTPAYDLQGHLIKEDKQWTFSPFSGRVGHSDLEGNVVYDTSGKLPLLKGTLKSQRLDVADLGGLIGLQPAKKTVPDKNAALLPDTPLDLKRLRNGDMNLTITAQKLNAPGWPLSEMNTHIVLTNGLLDLKPLRFGLADGKADGYVVIDGRKDIPAAQIDMAFQKLSLKSFFNGKKFGALSDGVFDARTQLSGNGASMAKILGDSNGRVAVVLPGGKVSLLLVRAAAQDVKLIPLLVGKDKTTNIRCGVGDFAVNNGMLNSQIFVLDTEASNIKGNAQINLKDEAIDASIDARSKDPSLLALQSKILIVGKLRDPHVTIDPLSTGVRGAAAVALAALAPVVAFLPFIEPGTGKNSNCSALLSQVEPAAGGK